MVTIDTDRRRYLGTLALATGITTLAGCSSSDDGGASASTESSGGGGSPEDVAATVAVTGDGYDPALVEVSAGEAVQWTNDSDRTRRVRSADPGGTPSSSWDMDAELQSGDGSTSYAFEESGYYWFYDDIQTRFQMCGVVVVDEDPSEVEDFDCRTTFA